MSDSSKEEAQRKLAAAVESLTGITIPEQDRQAAAELWLGIAEEIKPARAQSAEDVDPSVIFRVS